MSNLLWLISENDMDEDLLGQPLITVLEFDAIQHLKAVREDLQNMHSSALGPSNGICENYSESYF